MCIQAKRPIRQELIKVSVAGRVEIFIVASWMGCYVHLRITLSGSHVYTEVERGLKCLPCPIALHNVPSQVLNLDRSIPESSAETMKPPVPPSQNQNPK